VPHQGCKTGDILSKVGDPADYTITITNDGALTLHKDDITDTLLGNITLNGVDQVNSFITSNTCGASLAPSASCTITATRIVQAGDPDPLPNTVTVVYKGKADLSGSDISDSDDHSVNLFQPSITLDKTGDTLGKVGDPVDYTITLTNTSSDDSPPLMCSIRDSLLNIDEAGILREGDQHVIHASRTVQAGDPDPLPNTASARCEVVMFGNVLTASDSHSVNLFQPRIAIDKTGDTLSKVGDTVNYTITLSNNSSADTPPLDCTASDSLLGGLFAGVLPAGDTVIERDRVVQDGDPDPLPNTASVTCNVRGFPNVLEASDSHSVNLFQPSIRFGKMGSDKVGDVVTYWITLNNTSLPTARI
jgi:uncharacterized repeat protein (TIGR01451 family)